MSDSGLLSDTDVDRVRRRCRLLILLDAAERAAIAPLPSKRLHAFAYLADVLSPVWDLPPFDGKILTLEGGPHYADLQDELDHLVVTGLVEVFELKYVGRGQSGARLEGNYALDFSSPHLQHLLAALGAEEGKSPIDGDDRRVHAFLVELAGALAILSDDQVDRAISKDVTYRSGPLGENVVDFAAWAEDPWKANPSWRTADRFSTFLPKDSKITDGEKIYLYASYLGRVVNGY